MIGKNLKYYRLMSGLSQEELANKVGICKMAISNYEKDKREADSKMIIKLADALNIKAVNLIKLPSKNISITFGEFRKNSSLKLNDKDTIFQTIEHRLSNLEDIVSILGPNSIPKLFLPNKIKFVDIETSGLLIRKYLFINSTGPVGNILDYIENKGILICSINEKSNSFSGINGVVNNRPFITINTNMPGERQRFTLIHELAHILFDFDGIEDVEKCIDGITGAFFLPEQDIKRELGISRTNIMGELKYLGQEYGVSMQCVLIRAKQTGIINNTTYLKHQKMISKLGLRKNECSNIPSLESNMLERLVVRALAEDVISISKANELLDNQEDSFYTEIGFEVTQ